MEATIEAPAHNIAELGAPYRLDSDRAAELAKKRWDAVKAEKEARRIAAEAVKDAEQAKPTFITRQIENLEEAIAELDEQMEGMTDPDAWHKLTTSRSKLFEQWRILSGIPMPGSRKPAADKPTRQRSPMADPA